MSVAQGATRRQVSAFAAALALVGGLTLLRLVVLFATPLELYPDEAQYWAWAQQLSFGYVSKPPLVAWLIWLTTGVGGDAEPWVRLAAPLVHAGAALALQRAGQRLYGGWAGFWGATLYMLMPGVQLSAGVITTDAPLFLFLALSLWAYVAMLQAADPAERLRWAAILGAALGLAWLSKYAAAYFLVGLVAHAVVDPDARRAWGRRNLLATAGLLLLAVAPNALWNLNNGFATLGHTLQNASWGPPLPSPAGRPDGPDVYDFRDAPGFLVSQFGVFGPIPFTVLLLGAALGFKGRRLPPPDRLLLCFVAPPLLIVLAQALISRANANWGAAGYGAASLLVAAWLLRWRARSTLTAALAIQAAFAALFLAVAAWPPLADQIGLSNSFKHARGWAQTTQVVLARAAAERSQGRLAAIAVDDRFLFSAMGYYGRAYFGQPDAPRLLMWMRRPDPYTQAEMDAPLSRSTQGRVLGASLGAVYLEEMEADFARVTPLGSASARIDPARRRDVGLFLGDGFNPGPRDPRTGLPILGAPPVEG